MESKVEQHEQAAAAPQDPAYSPPDAESCVLNSGDLTRDKIAKLVEMVIDDN